MLKTWQFWATVALVLAGVLVYRTSVSASTDENPAPQQIAFITGGDGPYWQAIIAGAMACANERDITLDVRKPESQEDAAEQVRLLSTLSDDKFDAVAISPVDPEMLTNVINTIATDKPVVTFDSDAPDSSRHGYVGTSNFSAGLMAGTLVKQAIPDGGKIAVLMTNESKSNVVDRRAGFKTRIEESPNPAESPIDPRFKVVGYFTDDGDEDKTKENIEKLLEDHPDLACLITLNAYQGPIAATMLREMEKTGDTKLVTFDAPEETLKAIEDGVVYATVAQDPFQYGYQAVEMLDHLCRSDRRYLPVVGRGAIHVSVEPLRKENIAEFRKRAATRMPDSRAG